MRTGVTSQLVQLGINKRLYGDDGLAICNKTQRQTENIETKCNIFKENKLKVPTIEVNVTIVDFLSIAMG